MACFLVSAAEAVVVTAVTKVTERKGEGHPKAEQTPGIPFVHKLKWLSHMLWGGSALLMFEHLWHGEIVPYFPFLTAMNTPADLTAMLTEMGSVGVTMAALITAVWGGMVLVTHSMEKNALQADPTSPSGPADPISQPVQPVQ